MSTAKFNTCVEEGDVVCVRAYVKVKNKKKRTASLIHTHTHTRTHTHTGWW